MSLPDLSSTARTELGRHSERGRTERDDLYAVLDAGLICHLGVIVEGAPRVLPTGYGRLGDLLYLHGSSANSSIMAGNGQEICVTVTHLDGLVCARSVFNHSMNYRSAVVFGVARLVTDPEEKILAWLDSWHIPRRCPAGAPTPFRTAARPRSRAQWALGGHFGASQVPDCDSVGPGGIDIDQIARADTVVRELSEPALTGPAPMLLGPRTTHELQAAAPSLSAAAV